MKRNLLTSAIAILGFAVVNVSMCIANLVSFHAFHQSFLRAEQKAIAAGAVDKFREVTAGYAKDFFESGLFLRELAILLSVLLIYITVFVILFVRRCNTAKEDGGKL